MELALKILLALHVLCGFTALAMGLGALVVLKGGKSHKRMGMVYFYAMIGVAITAVSISIPKQQFFLLMIAIFSFFQCYFGFRTTRDKAFQANPADWAVLGLAAVNSFFMIYSLNIVLVVFGSISTILTLGHFRLYLKSIQGKSIPRNTWLRQHIGMMMGSFIATVTAFVLVNVRNFEPAWLPWLAPTVILVPLIAYYQRKYAPKRPSVLKNSVLLLLVFSAISGGLQAQPYVEGGLTRHRFAQLNLGVEVGHFASEGKANLGAAPIRAIIGGTHFWGHADFFVAFTVAQATKSDFSSGVETGGKYYPWRIEDGKLRPFIGASWLTTRYRDGNGATLIQNRWPLTAGLAYNSGNLLVEFTTGYLFDGPFDYYTSRETFHRVQTPRVWGSIGVKYMMETTLSAENDWKSGRTKILTDTLAKLGRLDGWTIAVGPSAGIYLGKSSHNTMENAYLGQHRFTNTFLDLGVGYYIHKPDVHVNLAWRQNKSVQDAYGTEQTMRRKSLALEAYKFLGDYHGFVPFVGPSVGYEWLEVEEKDGGDLIVEAASNSLKPGITFGWDIRPNSLQAWYLRTNLRWVPNLNVAMSGGGKMDFTQLEFNYIQLVIFPGRFF